MPYDIRELKERIWDLTRELDESPAAEEIPEIEAKLNELVDLLNERRSGMGAETTGGARSAAPSGNAEEIVRRFCEAWSHRDVDELLSFFADDAIYHNMPIEAVRGQDGIRNMLNLFVPGADAITFEIVHIASSGDVVHTERVDTFVMSGRNVVIPVAGVFELRDGKIAAWRDYFDMTQWTSQTTG